MEAREVFENDKSKGLAWVDIAHDKHAAAHAYLGDNADKLQLMKGEGLVYEPDAVHEEGPWAGHEPSAIGHLIMAAVCSLSEYMERVIEFQTPDLPEEVRDQMGIKSDIDMPTIGMASAKGWKAAFTDLMITGMRMGIAFEKGQFKDWQEFVDGEGNNLWKELLSNVVDDEPEEGE